MNALFLTLLNPKCKLHAGLSISGDRFHYVLVARPVKGESRIIQTRTGALADMRFYTPCPVNAGLETAAALLVREKLVNTTAEQWLDEHEERIIPKGLQSDQIVNEWYVDNEMLVSATILKASLHEIVAKLRNGVFSLRYLGLPLFDLSRLYSHHKEGPFFIWRLFPRQSIIGYVENGCLRGLCNFWMGSLDIAEATEESIDQFRKVCRSLSGQTTMSIVAVMTDPATQAAFNTLPGNAGTIVSPPEIKGIAWEYHDAYALALHEEPGLDFAPMEHSVEAGSLEQSRLRALKLLRTGCMVLLFAVAALLCVKAAVRGAAYYAQRKIEPQRAHTLRFQFEKSRVDSLTLAFKKKSQFLAQKSALTFPITEMQTSFPEGLRAEEIDFSEADPDTWNMTVIAYAAASGMIPDLIKNLSAINGMKGIRMIYSELAEAKGKSGQREIKFKIEGAWKQ